MNRRQLQIALALMTLLAILGAAVIWSERESWAPADNRAGQKVAPGLKLSDVAEIAIRDAAGELHILRDKQAWTISERAGFPAETDRVAEFLVKVAELKVVQSERLAAELRPRFGLVEPRDKAAPNTGTLLELRDVKGGPLVRLLLGKKIVKGGGGGEASPGDAGASGRYLTASTNAETLLAVGETLGEAESKAEPWLRKDLIRVERPKSITASKDNRLRWKLTRASDSSDWVLSGPNPKPDLQKATDIASSMGWVNLAEVVAAPEKVESGLDHPLVVTAETFDGPSYTLKIGNRAGDSYYVRVEAKGALKSERKAPAAGKAEDKEKKQKELEEHQKKAAERLARDKALEKWTYLVAKSTVEPLLRDRAGLLPEKKGKK